MSTQVPPSDHPMPSLGIGSEENGLTDAQFRQIVQHVWALPGRWMVERNEDDLGNVFALLIQDLGGKDGVTFALFRSAHRINLDLCRGAHLEAIDTFDTVKQAMTHVLHIARRAGPGGLPGADEG